MVVKLYGSPSSTCTRRVGLVLEELNIPYELVTINLAAMEQKSPAFLEHQPFGIVPYIVDNDGYELYESRAICRYLAAKYQSPNSSLLPISTADIRKWGRFEQAASLETSSFDMYASEIAAELVFRPAKGLGTDEAQVRKLTDSLNRKLDVYDVILSKQKYLAGDEVTLADLFHLSYGTLITKIGINSLEDEVKRPHVARWWKDISSRPAWQTVKERVPASSS